MTNHRGAFSEISFLPYMQVVLKVSRRCKGDTFVKKKIIIGFKSCVLKAQCYIFYYHNSKNIVVRT